MIYITFLFLNMKIIFIIIIIHLFQFGFTKIVYKIISYNMTN